MSAAVRVWYTASQDAPYKLGYVRKMDLPHDSKNPSSTVIIPVFANETLAGANDRVPESRVWRANDPDTVSRAGDMTSLAYLEEPNMIHCLGERYARDKIYTGIAGVLVAVNPYKRVGAYDEATMRKYRELKNASVGDPHVFNVAERAFRNLRRYNSNQSIICCGESGSGKTESTKWLMRYLTNSRNDSRDDVVETVEQQVLQTNVVTEAFGNARTLMNNNSSRFAKFIRLYVDVTDSTPRAPRNANSCAVTGCSTETYLLERSRITRPPTNERNFHVFYQLCAASARDAALRKRYHVPEAKKLAYLSAGGVTEIPNVDDAKQFDALRKSLDTLGASVDIFDVVAAVLHIGEIDCKDPDSKHSTQAVRYAAELLGVTEHALRGAVLTRNIHVAGSETYSKTLEPTEAVANRDAIAKALYNALFKDVIDGINGRLSTTSTTSTTTSDARWIGILDVFGFESFERNSYEQFCINFANERLQDFFNNHILKSEQEEYTREAIQWDSIQVRDNSDTIALLDGGATGVFSLLDSACIVPNGSAETFVDSVLTVHSNHRALRRVGLRARTCGFRIVHYAAEVEYDASEFLTKNNDSLHPDVLSMFSRSTSSVVSRLFASDGNTSSRRVRRFKSIGRHFCGQLKSLVQTLSETKPYFVRCLNPNPDQKPNQYDPQYVAPQARCGGLVETLRMLKYGYPFRVRYTLITDSYLPKLGFSEARRNNVNVRNLCEAVLMAHRARDTTVDKLSESKNVYQLGLSKIFFRSGQQDLLERVEDFAQRGELPRDFQDRVCKWLLKRRMDCVRGVARSAARMQVRLRKIRAVRRLRNTVRVVVGLTGALRRARAALGKQQKTEMSSRASRASRAPIDVFRNKELETNLDAAKTKAELLSAQVDDMRRQKDEALRKVQRLAEERERAVREQEEAFEKREAELRQQNTAETLEAKARLKQFEEQQEAQDARIRELASQERALMAALREREEAASGALDAARDAGHKLRELETLLEEQKTKAREAEERERLLSEELAKRECAEQAQREAFEATMRDKEEAMRNQEQRMLELQAQEQQKVERLRLEAAAADTRAREVADREHSRLDSASRVWQEETAEARALHEAEMRNTTMSLEQYKQKCLQAEKLVSEYREDRQREMLRHKKAMSELRKTMKRQFDQERRRYENQIYQLRLRVQELECGASVD